MNPAVYVCITGAVLTDSFFPPRRLLGGRETRDRQQNRSSQAFRRALPRCAQEGQDRLRRQVHFRGVFYSYLCLQSIPLSSS